MTLVNAAFRRNNKQSRDLCAKCTTNGFKLGTANIDLSLEQDWITKTFLYNAANIRKLAYYLHLIYLISASNISDIIIYAHMSYVT